MSKKITLEYNPAQKKKASTLLSLAVSELEAAVLLFNKEFYRETIVHMYFSCFYTSQALLSDKLKGTRHSHPHVECTLHNVYGESQNFPTTYVDLHKFLRKMRTTFNYKTSHSPDPKIVKSKLNKLKFYVKYALKSTPTVTINDIMQSILNDNRSYIKDFSYDIYCPKTYSHHARITFWCPPFYLGIFSTEKLEKEAQQFLKSIKVNRYSDYLVGLNSKTDQYSDSHFIMLDIDTLDPIVEAPLKEIGGVILKSGRGYHFISKKVISGENEWKKKMSKILQHRILKKCIDKDHIQISLKRGYSTLRITRNEVKSKLPIFYKEF